MKETRGNKGERERERERERDGGHVANYRCIMAIHYMLFDVGSHIKNNQKLHLIPWWSTRRRP